MIEKRNTPTITIVTDYFKSMAEAEAKTLGCERLHILTIQHPIGGLDEVDLEEKGKELWANFQMMTQNMLTPGNHLQTRPDERPGELLELPDNLDYINKYYDDQNWADGFPIIPPTFERVKAMLNGEEPQSAAGYMAPGGGLVTAEKMAVNAVMAGCLPEYFPLIKAAVSALLEEKFNLYGIQTTTHPCGPLLIVNGPLIKKLGLNFSTNCFGNGRHANATIGRAIRLILVNLGGAVPGELDMATMGQPGKYSACIAENEENNPWNPLHIERGFSTKSSTVTVMAAEAPRNINDHDSASPEDILRTIAGAMTVTGCNNYFHQGDIAVILSPEHATTITKEYRHKKDIKDRLFELCKISAKKLSYKRFKQVEQAKALAVNYDEQALIPICSAPEDINIIVAGGPGKHSMWVPTFGVTRSVTKVIEN